MINKFGDAEIQKKAKQKKQAILENYTAKNTLRSNYVRKLSPTYQWRMYELFNGKNSRKTAVNMKCLDCSSFSREEVRNCQVSTCPLYDIRPYQD